MRTLSCALTTAQQSNSRVPYLELNFYSRDAATTRSYTTADSPNKIISVIASEAQFGGGIATDGGDYSAVIRLRDTDGTLGLLSFSGYRLEIEWGFDISGCTETSRGAPLLVHRKRRIQVAGDLIVELYCLSLWDLLGRSFLTIDTAGQTIYNQDTSIRHILMDYMAGFDADQVWQFEDSCSAYTDFTSEAADASAGDVEIYPCFSQTGDIFYIGSASIFNRVSIDIDTGVSGLVLAWEYWDGCTWNALTELGDNTNAFLTSDLNIISFRTPSDWAVVSINCSDNLYYIRARITSTTGNQPLATKIKVGMHFGLQLDTSDCGQGDDFMPDYISDYRRDKRYELQGLLRYTKLGIVIEDDGFHLKYIDSSDSCAVYTYENDNTGHEFYSNIQEDEDVIPNTFIYTDTDPLNQAGCPNVGSANNSDSVTNWGTIAILVPDTAVVSDCIGDDLAEAALDHLVRDKAKGVVVANMNVGQEVWDVVEIQDTITSSTYTGHVTRLVRSYQRGIYLIELQMGGYTSSAVESWERLVRIINALRAREAAEALQEQAYNFAPVTPTPRGLLALEEEPSDFAQSSPSASLIGIFNISAEDFE